MKLGFISDLHIDINEKFPVIQTLADSANDHKLTHLIIAGDISENYQMTMEAIRQLQSSCNAEIFYVPGNHDLWNKHCSLESTQSIYERYKSDEKCLIEKTVELDASTVLLGDVGWYDYSFASNDYSFEALESMENNGRTWQDKYYNDWTSDNQRQFQNRKKILEQLMKQKQNMAQIVVMHMLPIREFCVPETVQDWSFFNAFLGSEDYQSIIDRYYVRYVVCGHVHYRRNIIKNGTVYICPCLGYYTEWPLYKLEDNSVSRHIEDALYIPDERISIGERN